MLGHTLENKGRVVSYPGSLFSVVGVEGGTFSIGLLEKREDNLEKNEDLAPALIDDVS